MRLQQTTINTIRLQEKDLLSMLRAQGYPIPNEAVHTVRLTYPNTISKPIIKVEWNEETN